MTTKPCSALLLVLALSACGGGGGGGGGSAPPPMTDDDARRAVLADLGEDLILPALRDLDTRSAALAPLVAALAAAPLDATARGAAQAGWRSAMEAVERAEVLQIGPAARSSEPGGMDLRDQIYAFPLLNRCRVLSAAYTDEAVTGSSPIDGTGMGALEYLLFSGAPTGCLPPPVGVNVEIKVAQHASRIANRIAVVAAQLRKAWEPGGGNFLRNFSTAGAGSTMPFSTPQMALDALSTAIFYAEKETKDRKIANPTGIGATGLLACNTASCPERVESVFARASGDHIRANLQAFRDVFTGIAGGMGINALLEGIDRGALGIQIVTQIDAALAAEAAITPDFETAVAAIDTAAADSDDRAACMNASANRSGEPAACALLGLVDAAADTLRADIASTLNLRIPDNAAGDND